mmetsp:Transcript_29358/g.32623  ORF Transcript_29358/g.32623 Transcript_29358/m.32623 type:complete len:110 (-) Transcript_29358:389-718(-)
MNQEDAREHAEDLVEFKSMISKFSLITKNKPLVLQIESKGTRTVAITPCAEVPLQKLKTRGRSRKLTTSLSSKTKNHVMMKKTTRTPLSGCITKTRTKTVPRKNFLCSH